MHGQLKHFETQTHILLYIRGNQFRLLVLKKISWHFVSLSVNLVVGGALDKQPLKQPDREAFHLFELRTDQNRFGFSSLDNTETLLCNGHREFVTPAKQILRLILYENGFCAPVGRTTGRPDTKPGCGRGEGGDG